MAESPETKYYREQEERERERIKNRAKMAKAVREKLLEQEKNRSKWQKVKDYFSGKVLESEKAHPSSEKGKSENKTETTKKSDRTTQVESGLRKAGLTEKEIKKLKNKKNK